MKRYLVILILLGLFVCPGNSFARDHHDRHDNDRRHRHYSSHYDPWWDFGWRYRHQGWYRSGAVVADLPFGYVTLSIAGAPYYYYDDIYFRPCRGGYMVVERPVAVREVVVQQEVVAAPVTDPLIINVPNANGTYTPVQLVRKGEGYVGPQGEYYDTNPSVEQLRVLYGKY